MVRRIRTLVPMPRNSQASIRHGYRGRHRALGSGCAGTIGITFTLVIGYVMTACCTNVVNRQDFGSPSAMRAATEVMDHDGDVIRIVEGRGTAMKVASSKIPLRRSKAAR